MLLVSVGLVDCELCHLVELRVYHIRVRLFANQHEPRIRSLVVVVEDEGSVPISVILQAAEIDLSVHLIQ